MEKYKMKNNAKVGKREPFIIPQLPHIDSNCEAIFKKFSEYIEDLNAIFKDDLFTVHIPLTSSHNLTYTCAFSNLDQAKRKYQKAQESQENCGRDLWMSLLNMEWVKILDICVSENR